MCSTSFNVLLTNEVCNSYDEWIQQIKYTLLRICSTPSFPIFNLSRFEREPLKLHKQMTPYFLALDVGSKISQAQLCSFIRGCHTTFLLKNTLFKEEVAWQPLIKQEGCSPSMLEVCTKAFKWGIVWFSIINTPEDIGGYIKKCWFYLVKTYIFGYNH